MIFEQQILVEKFSFFEPITRSESDLCVTAGVFTDKWSG